MIAIASVAYVKVTNSHICNTVCINIVFLITMKPSNFRHFTASGNGSLVNSSGPTFPVDSDGIT